jgi:hypothetical protein
MRYNLAMSPSIFGKVQNINHHQSTTLYIIMSCAHDDHKLSIINDSSSMIITTIFYTPMN